MAEREVLAQMIKEQDNRLVLMSQQSDQLVKQANATVLSANGLALVAGILGFVALRRAQREAERSLRNEVKALQASRASEEKSAFLANMSHEIRTPMNAIFGFAQLLSESVKAPIERDWVQSIKKSGQMLLNLINNVLDLSKIEAGKFQLSPHATDIRQTLQETIEMFSALAGDKGIMLKYEIDESAMTNLDVDAPRLRQVLTNLISNALKYTETGGVLVRLQLLPSLNEQLLDLRISVVDTGVGIAEEQLHKIFDPFHQADSPDGKVRQGTGLGLSITRRLLDLMGGHISVDSKLGKGSRFTVDIPQLRVSEKALTPASVDDRPIDFNRLRPLKILVVDDMVLNAQVAQGYLGKSHHSVYVAGDGIEGVSAAKRLRPDVVLMDLRMPRMNGFEAFDAIRAEATLGGTSIIAVTASSLAGEEIRLRASFDGYIRKPFSSLDLFVELEAIFGAKAAPAPTPALVLDLTQPPANLSAELQQRWARLHDVQLTALRRTMRMREIAAFALDLRALGDDLKWPKLLAHAVTLDAAVRQFDIPAVKRLLNDLVDWPKDLAHGE
jgi:signal transduction histidine kinase/DNA-binding response OmpR family regulator